MKRIILSLLLSSMSFCFATELQVSYKGETRTISVPSDKVEYLKATCLEFKVPLYIGYRLFLRESSFNPRAVHINIDGSVDAGLGQLNSEFLDWFAQQYNHGIPINPFDWKVNMRVSIQHFARMKRLTGNWGGGCGAYRLGLDGYKRNKLKLSQDVKDYISFIID